MEQTKTFKLPNSFAYKWVTALRSGEYEQLEGQLIDCVIHSYTEEIPKIERSNMKKGCCLGVAAVMCGATDIELRTYGMPTEIAPSVLKRIGYPKELLIRPGEELLTPLPTILASLNDGISLRYAEEIQKEYSTIKFNKLPESYCYEDDSDGEEVLAVYSFEEIAQFIEDNVEFYDDGED